MYVVEVILRKPVRVSAYRISTMYLMAAFAATPRQGFARKPTTCLVDDVVYLVELANVGRTIIVENALATTCQKGPRTMAYNL